MLSNFLSYGMKSDIELKITLLWLLWLQSAVKCRPIPCPLSKNIARYGPNGEIVDCVPCANCPIGQGLSFPCGSRVSNSSKIECVFCETNKTYSDDHGKGHCKTCQDCGVRNVIQECTINQNRECGKTCPKGYDFDNTFDDCVEEPESEMSTTISTHSTKTVKLKTSGKETTETPHKREAQDVTTTASSDSIDINSSQPKFPSTGVDNTPSQGTSLKGTNNSPYVWSTKEVQLQQDHKALLIAIFVLIAVLIVVTIIVLMIVCKKGQDHSTSKRDGEPRDIAEENIPLTDIDESEGSSQATISSSSTQEDLRDPALEDNATEPLLTLASVDIPTDNNISRNEVSSHATDAQGEDDMNVENIPAEDLRDSASQDNATEPILTQTLVDIPTDNNISIRNEVSSHASDAQGKDDVTVENIPADVHVSQMEMLSDVNGTLFMYVQTQLDAGETCTRKTWRSVGRELKAHSDKLNLIQADGRSPTECLLEYFKTLEKEPTMREFVQALKNCGRNDIARYICNWPWAN